MYDVCVVKVPYVRTVWIFFTTAYRVRTLATLQSSSRFVVTVSTYIVCIWQWTASETTSFLCKCIILHCIFLGREACETAFDVTVLGRGFDSHWRHYFSFCLFYWCIEPTMFPSLELCDLFRPLPTVVTTAVMTAVPTVMTMMMTSRGRRAMKTTSKVAVHLLSVTKKKKKKKTFTSHGWRGRRIGRWRRTCRR